MKNLSKFLSLSFLLLISGRLWAQNNVEMADTMRSEGKIYVVVAMILIILAGFIVYLVFLDRRLNRLEKEVNDKNHRTN